MLVFGQRARQGGLLIIHANCKQAYTLFFVVSANQAHMYVRIITIRYKFGAAQDTLYPLLLSARTMNICIPAFSTFHRHTILHAVISFHRKLCIRMQGMLDIPCPIQFCCNRYIPIPKLFRYLSKITLQCCIFVTMQL